MDEIRKEVLKLKIEELKARLKDVPFIPTDDEKSLLEKWEAEMSISTDNTPIIIPPVGKLATECISDDAQKSFLDTKEGTIEFPSQDMLKNREDLMRKVLLDHQNKQNAIPQGGVIYRTILEQWILNEKVKVLFDEESLMKVFQNANIEGGDKLGNYYAMTPEQRRKELRENLRSGKPTRITKRVDSPSPPLEIICGLRGALDVRDIDKTDQRNSK